MKRLMRIFLLCLLCLVVTACGAKDEKTQSEHTADTPVQTESVPKMEREEPPVQEHTGYLAEVEAVQPQIQMSVEEQPEYENPWLAATAPGTLSMEDAAAVLAEEIAYRYWDLPPSVEWRPVDMQAGETVVFDIYYGDPVHFCCTMQFYLLPDGEDYSDPARAYWTAGSGLGEPLTEGDYADYYIWKREVLVQKNAEGDWYCAARGTGGYTVCLPYSPSVGAPDYIGNAPLAELVRLLTLTEGYTHDWILPLYICEREEELTGLNGILAEYDAKQAEGICRALAAYLSDDIYIHEGELTLSALLEVLDPVYHQYFA